MEQQERKCKMIYSCFWKVVWYFLTKINIILPYYPAILLPGFFPNKLKIYVHTKTCIQMFIVALFIIVKNWSNWNIFQWMNKQIVVFSWNGILFSDKKNKWGIKPWKTWENVKCIILSESSESEKYKNGMIPAIWNSAKCKIIETV